jgi:hypothetical protein
VNAEGGQNVYINRFQSLEQNLSIEQDLSLVKTDFAPSIRAPLSTLPYLQVNATAAYRTTYYSESLADDLKTQVDVPITRNYGDLRVDVVGPVLSRVFNPNNAMADRMKHVVEPTFSVSRRTEIANQDRIPSATGYDRVVGGTTQMSYGLTNRVLVRKDAEGQPQSGAPREFLNFSVRQTYYTDANASKYDQSYSYGFNTRAPNAFSPVSILARATPTIPMGIDFRMEYDPLALPGGPKLLGMGLNGLYRTAALNASGGWSRTAYALTSNTGAVTNASNMVQGSSDFRILQSSWSGMVSFQYDVTQSTLLSQRYVGSYSAQCCGVSFEYQAVNYPNTSQFFIPQDRRFNMSFTLAGVGSFANFFGAFGGGTR